MKEMLICSDLDENSDQNLKSGFAFARAIGLKPKIFHIDTLTPQLNKVFHASTIKPHYVSDPVWKKDIEATVSGKVNSALERVGIDKKDVDFESFEGTVSEGIDHLKKHKDLEIMSIGATHHGDLHRFFLNTFAEKSFFHVHKDVLINKRATEKLHHITYLIPYAPLNEEELKKVSHIAKDSGAKIHMDCVVPFNFVGYNLELFPTDAAPREIFKGEMSEVRSKAEKELQKAQEILKKDNVESSYSLEMVLNEDSTKQLEKIVERENSDLVIIRPEHSIFEHLSIGSLTLAIIQNVSCNLLLLKSTQR